ncbi:MAG: hypothetical protein KAV87_28805 [Desulfobacteraceae bacterium]|nr:hypothetical protein [Desulfobacteraceae bacterium]
MNTKLPIKDFARHLEVDKSSARFSMYVYGTIFILTMPITMILFFSLKDYYPGVILTAILTLINILLFGTFITNLIDYFHAKRSEEFLNLLIDVLDLRNKVDEESI